MLCENVKSYLANSKGLPFFYVVGDEDYKEILSEFTQSGVIIDRVSDFCPKDDKYPDIDDIIDHFRTLDMDYRQNKHVLIGLGEYLALRGAEITEKVLRRLKNTTLGTARVIILLRCVTPQINNLATEDGRIAEQKRLLVGENAISSLNVTCVKYFAQDNVALGIKNLLHDMEDCCGGKKYVKSDLDFSNSLIPVTYIHTAFSAVKQVASNSELAENMGTEAQWDRFFQELSKSEGSLDALFLKYGYEDEYEEDIYEKCAGFEFKNWIFFVFLKQKCKDALEAMIPWLQDEYGNASQPYSFSRKPKKALAEARALIASCIGAQPEEIFFTSGGTESDNWAIKGLLQYGDFRDTITSQIEHHAILQACQAIERLGYPVTYLPVNQQGGVTSEALSRIITDNTKLVSVMMANNEIGTVEPIEELARIAHAHGALIHTDAVQAVGHIPIDVNALGVDLLSASAHKFNGPKGIGFLYIRRGTSIHPFADGGAQEFGMRAGTENVAAIVGMSVALKKNCDHMVEIGARLHKLEQVFLGTLQQAGIDFVRNGSENRVPGNISISIRGASGEMLLHRLDLKGIAISTGSACDSVNPQVSHVIQAIGVPNEYAEGTIRVSFGRDNQVEEARDVANAIICILNSKL